MSYSEVKASNVQKECMAIFKWEHMVHKQLSDKYRRFEKLVIKYINQGIKPTWWNKTPERPRPEHLEGWYRYPNSVFEKRMKYDRMKHVKHLRWFYNAEYAERAKVLLKLAERALSESNKLDMASIMISAEDAHYLKNTMDKTKEKK